MEVLYALLNHITSFHLMSHHTQTRRYQTTALQNVSLVNWIAHLISNIIFIWRGKYFCVICYEEEEEDISVRPGAYTHPHPHTYLILLFHDSYINTTNTHICTKYFINDLISVKQR